ncbi:MAG TPA: glycosyltransferase [Sphingobacteriaceae bacterium]
MKKKVYFILSHLGAGGSERVFWILSQYFDKSVYDVSLVLLDSRNPFFSTDLTGVNIINLNSIKASYSFFKLRKLIREEKPFAVFTTGAHINTLLSCVSLFAHIPKLIGRESSVADIMNKLGGVKERFWDLFVGVTYKRFNVAVCQSVEIKHSLAKHYHVPPGKLVVIPNPVLSTSILVKTQVKSEKKIILVGRLAVEKGIFRLLKVMRNLPQEYSLTIAGEGPLKKDIIKEIDSLQLSDRVQLTGLVNNITELIAKHDLMVLSSVTEGFPNVVLESLAVGVPVVSFQVGGIQAILKNHFNGYIIPQDDLSGFEKHIVKACNNTWDHDLIKADVNARFGVHQVVKQYEDLLSYN